MRSSRLAHWLTLVAVAGLLFLPNLGAHSLWDMDEGVNAECGREMLEAGTWVVPTFNWELRTAKPVLTYWLQRPAYQLLGVNELAARLPSALLGVGTVLVTYELGRRMFGPLTGLLGGVALASTIQFSVLSHAATPDAPLIFFTTLAYYLIWVGHLDGRRGFLVWPGVACGLAALAKGPVGLAFPGFVALVYFAWNRELRRLLDHRLLGGVLLFLLVAAPWYGLVAAETRGEWPRAFFLNENLNRATTPQESHRGPVWYYVGCVLVLFAPWSSVIGVTAWDAVRGARTVESPPTIVGGLSADARACRFLVIWVAAYLLIFSAAATKLPNYIAPAYPALALLTARTLVRWAAGDLILPRWVMPVAVGGVALTGAGFGLGLLLASGVVPVSGMRTFPGLEAWAGVGLLPLAAAGVMAWGLRAGNRPRVVGALTVAAVGLVGIVAAGPVMVVDRYKATKSLAHESGCIRPGEDVRLGSLQFTADSQSLVFYAGRRVEPLANADRAADFLLTPRPGYLFVPAAVWDGQLAARVPTAKVVAKKYAFYQNADIVAVWNGR
jgi:4-amino-4-deoxy-L-arabinose transferase-like glycosyltransferase